MRVRPVKLCVDNPWAEDGEQQSALTRRNMIPVKVVINLLPSQGGQSSLLPRVLLFSRLGAHDTECGSRLLSA